MGQWKDSYPVTCPHVEERSIEVVGCAVETDASSEEAEAAARPPKRVVACVQEKGRHLDSRRKAGIEIGDRPNRDQRWLAISAAILKPDLLPL
jgi:hypothetical protein